MKLILITLLFSIQLFSQENQGQILSVEQMSFTEVKKEIKLIEKPVVNDKSISTQFYGEGFILSLMYSKRVSNHFAYNAGFGIPFIPYASFSYLSGKKEEPHSFEMFAGINYVHTLKEDEPVEYGFSVMTGIAYRYFSQKKGGGFFARTSFGLAMSQLFPEYIPVLPFIGINLGYSFNEFEF